MWRFWVKHSKFTGGSGRLVRRPWAPPTKSPPPPMALGSTQPPTEMSTRYNSWRVKADDNLTIFLCRLSGNLVASNSWNPQGLSRPVQGLLNFTFPVPSPNLGNTSSLRSADCYAHISDQLDCLYISFYLFAKFICTDTFFWNTDDWPDKTSRKVGGQKPLDAAQ